MKTSVPSDSISRRYFGRRAGLGLGGMALASLLGETAGLPEEVPGARGLHHAPRAKRVIFLFQSGGPSQLDLFDPKPDLARLRGKELPPEIRMGQRITTMTSGQDTLPVAPSVFGFRRAGQSGTMLGDLLPHTAQVADDLCLIRSVHTNAINHEPGVTFLQTGHEFPGRPCLGSWVDYGLGSMNRDLPAFMVLTSNGAYQRSIPISSHLWGSAFLPSVHQGVALRPDRDPMLYLSDPGGAPPAANRGLIDAVAALNRLQERRSGDPEITTRIRQYEMAYRLQTSVPELADLAREPESTFKLYGEEARKPGTFAANCLMARRLVERDVRFVQLYHTGWDHHQGINAALPVLCRETDQASAALIRDLKRRDLLKDTLVIWGGEFGRTTFSQGDLGGRQYGRDHHPRCFSMWMAGGGVKAGRAFGLTDEYCYNVVENPVSVHDLQATILHLLGIDHQRQVFKFQGRRYRLTDVHGSVVPGLLG